MAGLESFTVLAVLEARDAASEVFAKIDESLGRFSDTAKSAADTARGAGDSIDDSLLKTASGADALDVASARMQAAQEQAARTADAQATAERNLLEAHKAAAAAADGDVAAQYRLMEANDKLTASSKANAAAQKDLAAAQKIAAAADTETVDAARASAAAQDEAEGNSAALAGGLSKVGKVAGITAIGLGVVAAVAVKAAGNFQSLTQHLVTDAGESQKNLAMVRAGILSISTATGTSAADVTNAMYHVESAGIHAGAGLAVAKVAAMGAKIGNADLDTVSKTLVGTLTAYGMRSTDAATQTKYATSVMEELIATTSSGDLRMQDLASSLSSVAPLAAKAGISLAQVGGAIATMTSQGMTARQATQDLAHTITSLQNPTTVQTQEMAQLGLNSQKVASQLGSKGLTGTIGELTEAITSHMPQGGAVIMSAFNKSTAAAQDAQIMLSKLPASIQGVAKAYLAGTTSYQTFNTATKSVGLQARALADQFATTAGKADGFNNLLRSGQPAVQTYTAALAKMTGGQTGLKTALMLTGKNAGIFAGNVATIAKQGKGAATMTQSWADIQGTFNQKVDVARTSLENTGIAIGSALLPAVTSLFSVIGKILIPVAEWTAKHQKLTAILFTGVTALLATVAVLVIAGKAIKAVSSAASEVGKAYKGAVAVVQKLAGVSKKTADQQVADAKKTAAANEEASVDSAAAAETSAGEQEAASGEAAAAAETDAAETAGANETAAVESSGSWVAAAGRQVAAAAGWAAQSVAKVAVVAAKNVAGAAATAGAWVAGAARQAASGVLWAAQGIGKVAVIVGANIAGAAATAAAWVIANAVMILGIGLLIAAVVLAVVLIVKNWGKISAAAKVVFHDVLAVIDSVISWVKGHWPLLLAILTGPIGLAVLMIKDHFKQVKDGALDVVHFIESSFKALLNLDSTLRSAGIKLIMGLVHGIESVAMAPVHAVESIVSDVRSLLPFSPAKKGPLSGGGSPDKAGAKFATMFAGGIASAAGTATSAASMMAASVSRQVAASALGHGTAGTGSSLALSAIGPAGGGAGAGTIEIHVHAEGAHLMTDADMNVFVSKIGTQIAAKILPAAGRKINIRG